MLTCFYIKTLFYRTTLISLFLFFAFLSSHGQTHSLDTIQNRFAEYQQHSLQEKLFIHTDRNLYVAGEIIWFKIYCIDATKNQLLNLSKVAYVEVLDEHQQPVLQAKISMKDGTGSGSFLLPSITRSGNYIFRAYTNWMKNFDPEFYFQKNITIINTIKANPVISEKTPDSFDVQFFPEGGDLVNELQSKVAFRITDASGKEIDFSGAIVNHDNDTIVRFHPAKFGIGNFIFTPKKNSLYRALIKPANGNVIIQGLPTVLDNGFVMMVNDPGENERLKIDISTNTPDQNIYLIITTRHEVKTTEVGFFKNGNAEFQIDKKKLGEGISLITLFNSRMQPVCERLYFKRPQQKLIIKANADEEQYSPRKKVTINLIAKDEADKPQQAEMSAAIFLTDSLSLPNEDIYSYLWLSSDLRGKVESPGYYFNNNSADANIAFDNLMLTHGWRRFNWQDVLQNKKPVLKFIPEYEGLIVSGKIVNRETEAPGANIPAFLSIPGLHFKLYSSKSSDDGLIQFNTKDFFGSKLIVAQTNAQQNSLYRIDLLSPFSLQFSSVKIPEFNLFKNLPSSLLQQSINMQVQNIYTVGKLNFIQSTQLDTSIFYGKAGLIYRLDDYIRFPTMEEVLREYVREVNVRKKGDIYSLSMVEKDQNTMVETKEPVVLLDGVPQFDNGNNITHYNPLKVKQIEIIKEKYFLGAATFDGIVSFSTYKGDLDGFELDTASTVVDYEALQFKREFYSPIYDTKEQALNRLPDFRNLLFWSPDIKTNEKGKKEITFYTSDQVGKYAVVLQGISQQGKAGSNVFMIEVKNPALK